MRTITVTVPGRPPTPNARRDWHVTYRDNKKWKDVAWLAAMDGLIAWGWPTRTKVTETRHPEVRLVAREPMRFCSLEVTIVVPDARDRDIDNAIASLKPLIDGCVAAGIVVDDSTTHIVEFVVRFRREARQSRVIMRFEEVQEPGSLGL